MGLVANTHLKRGRGALRIPPATSAAREAARRNSNGAPAVTLRANKPLTLMNTADGTKYRLILKPQGTAVPGAAGTTGTTPTVTLPASTP